MMSGILNMEVDTGRLVGQVRIDTAMPGVHVVLSSDTRFLEYSIRKLEKKYNKSGSGKSSQNRTHVAMILKQDRIIEGMTAAENIFLNIKDHWLFSAARREKQCETLFSRIGFYLPPGDPVEKLTASQKRFVEFYRALITKPDILIAEEVTSSLSYREVVYFRSILDELIDQGTGIVFFTTRWEEAIRVGDYFHVFIDGKEQKLLTKKEVQDNPQELYFLMMDLNIGDTPQESENDYKKWVSVIEESMKIENQLTRINTVLEAYCNRIKNLMSGKSCRIYLYLEPKDELIYLSGQSDEEPDYGIMKEEDIRIIMQTSTLHISDDRDAGFADLFESSSIPKCVVSYTMKNSEGNWLLIQIGTNNARRALRKDTLESLKYISIELLIFIENSRLKNQAYMLQESNHRIKNNMQMILSYIMMQRDSLKNQFDSEDELVAAENAFQQINDRIMAIYSVYDLMNGGTILEESIRFGDIIRVISHIYEDFLEITVNADPLQIPDRFHLAFCVIFNELMNNTVKHNKNISYKLRVNISLQIDEAMVFIEYHDNGQGLSSSPELGSPKEKQTQSYGIGLRLIRHTVTNDLKGTILIEESEGYKISIKFPLWQE